MVQHCVRYNLQTAVKWMKKITLTIDNVPTTKLDDKLFLVKITVIYSDYDYFHFNQISFCHLLSIYLPHTFSQLKSL